MRLAISALVFGAVAFAQQAPEVHLLDRLNPARQDRLAQRLKSLTLLTPGRLPENAIVLQFAPQLKVCAIPLRQALPQNDRTQYKMRIAKPKLSEEQLAATAPRIGPDACR